jgi:hypothetical protein
MIAQSDQSRAIHVRLREIATLGHSAGRPSPAARASATGLAGFARSGDCIALCVYGGPPTIPTGRAAA